MLLPNYNFLRYLLKKAEEVTVTFSLAGLDFAQMQVTVTFDPKILRRYFLSV